MKMWRTTKKSMELRTRNIEKTRISKDVYCVCNRDGIELILFH